MDVSKRCMDFIVSFEGKHKLLPDGTYQAYLDKLADPPVWTLYCGLTRGIKPGMTCTAEEGDKMFAKELAVHEDAVERLVKVPLNQNQFDALVSFSYNCGVQALQQSTLLRVLNQGKYDQVPAQMARWVYAGGKIHNGLVRRRKAEGALFMQPVPDELPSFEANTHLDNIPDDERMPQSVKPGPATSLPQAAKSSWTIKGALVALAATVSDAAVDAYHWATGITTDAGKEFLTLQQTVKPFDTILLTIKSALPILAVVGIAIVIFRRLSAAYEGKVG